MKNKVLIKMEVPSLDKSFDLFIPVNELVWRIIALTIKSCYEMCGYSYDQNKKCVLINKKTNEIYNPNSTIYDSTIRNGTELIAVFIK